MGLICLVNLVPCAGERIEDIAEFDPLTGKKIALFGLGDAFGYAENFLDALGLLWDEVKKCGAPELIGVWPTEGYTFDESVGKFDEDHFLGLGLDEDNEPDLHDERIAAWVAKVKGELGLS